MSKFPLLIAAAASLVSLSSCIPPEPPPPRFRPNPPFAPEPVDPYGTQYDTPPPAPPQQAPTVPPALGGYPTATATANPDQVLSPYEPFNVIDISGPPRIESGKLARDPSNNKIFRVP